MLPEHFTTRQTYTKSARPIAGYDLTIRLQKEGLLPPECAHVSLHFDVDGVVQLHYIVNVQDEDIPALMRALAASIEKRPLPNARGK